jgi:hypothetical protein
MKKVVAYINTVLVHWVVDELQNIGIDDISIHQRFKPLSEISRLEFLCADENAESVRSIIHKIGNNGSLSDHLIEIFDPPNTKHQKV